ncbi:MAG: sigma 54-interacting transcriptional regulator [Planctomycetota bacterium]
MKSDFPNSSQTPRDLVSRRDAATRPSGDRQNAPRGKISCGHSTEDTGIASTDSAASLLKLVARSLQIGMPREQFYQAIFPEVMPLMHAQAGGIVVQQHGRWDTACWFAAVAEETAAQRLPKDQQVPQDQRVPAEQRISDDHWVEAIDSGGFWFRDNVCIMPISQPGTRPEQPQAIGFLLDEKEATLVHADPARREHLQHVVQWLATAVWRFQSEQDREHQIDVLRRILAAAATWQSIDDVDALLEAIATVAADLVDAERVSIFLWDRRRKKLVGRPALGVEGGKLEVQDDQGIVGQVLHGGSAQRWRRGEDRPSELNAQVDSKLGYQTNSLAAVPMVDAQDRTIGVFEAINHRGGGFRLSDLRTLDDLALHATAAIVSQGIRQRLTATRDRLVQDAESKSPLIGQHESIALIRKEVSKVAKTELTVLIRGDNGTGKEVLARQIHYQSGRRNTPFVAVNCAALVETLLESELFGHEKGAFTDAIAAHAGKFESANGGTLFLDEIGDMSPGGQAKLLRVLEEKVVIRVGGSVPIPVDVRVIAATNQALDELIAEKQFRQDLFFRLNVVSLHLPPLAARGDDVIVLAEHFLDEFAAHLGRPHLKLDDSARDRLRAVAWPGNIRQLRNTMERASYLTDGEWIRADDLGLHDAKSGSGARADETLNDATRTFQVAHIETAIADAGGNMTNAAARLGLHRSNLYRKMRQLGMTQNGNDAPEK